MALSLVFFASNYGGSLYQTFVLLIFAYTVRFLPEALGSSRAALLQVNPHTEEALAASARAAARVFARITAPQIVPAMSAGALLVFITVMKELQVTLLLSPIGLRHAGDTGVGDLTRGILHAGRASSDRPRRGFRSRGARISCDANGSSC